MMLEMVDDSNFIYELSVIIDINLHNLKLIIMQSLKLFGYEIVAWYVGDE